MYLLKSIEPVRSPDSAGLRPDPERVDACIAIGLPVGVAIVIALARATHELERITPNLVDPVTRGHFLTEIRYFLALCILGGAVGAVFSVMTRITRGSRLFVDTDQSLLVRVSSGAFRPLIGAVSGAAMYVLVKGALLRFAPPAGNREAIFYDVELAFISGFSERWAQDTIVSSVPRTSTPSAVRPDPVGQP